MTLTPPLLATSIITFSVLLSGCAAQLPLSPLPTVNDAGKAATIKIDRLSTLTDSMVTFYITLNGKPIKTISNGQSINLSLNPGQYQLGIQCYLNTGWRHENWTIAVKPQAHINYQIKAPNAILSETVTPYDETIVFSDKLNQCANVYRLK